MRLWGGYALDLQSLGWNSRFSTELNSLNDPSLVPARVILGERELCTVACVEGELHGELAGSFRREASETGAYPVVGDWVAVLPRLKDGRATIHAILPRTNAFVRRAATGWTSQHGRVRGQVVAANIDFALIVCALDRDWNLRRLERYLTLAWGSGIQPMVVLNKVDLCLEREARIA
jgi:ribosome biogenesis GTPase